MEQPNNISKTLPSSDIFVNFGAHNLGGWTAKTQNSLRTETLIGFELLDTKIPKDEGSAYILPHYNGMINHSSYDGHYDANIIFKGIYPSKEAFEADHSRIYNGIAYYDSTLDATQQGDDSSVDPDALTAKIYYAGEYYDADYSNLNSNTFGATLGGEFSAGLFPKTELKWKDITTRMTYKGVFANTEEFEDAHFLTSGLAYYNKEEKRGYVYYNKLYYTFDDLEITYTKDFEEDFDSFPRKTEKWNVITEAGRKRSKTGWPPPSPTEDIMSRFLYSIMVDPTASKTKSFKIRYDVKIVTLDPGSDAVEADPSSDPPIIAQDEILDIYTISYRQDTYTYSKTLVNTLSDAVSSQLDSFFSSFPKMDYSTGEVEKI